MGVATDIRAKWKEYDEKHMQRKINIASQRSNAAAVHIICRIHGNCKRDSNKEACMTCSRNTGNGVPFYQRTDNYKPRIEGLKYI